MKLSGKRLKASEHALFLFLIYFSNCLLLVVFVFSSFFVLVSSKGESGPERKETRQKVDEDRKHEYPFSRLKHDELLLSQMI